MKYLLLSIQQNSFEPFEIKACVNLCVSAPLQSKAPAVSFSLFPYFFQVSLNGKHPPRPAADVETMLGNQISLSEYNKQQNEWYDLLLETTVMFRTSTNEWFYVTLTKSDHSINV